MQELVIESGRTKRHYWRDMGRYRELFYHTRGSHWFLLRDDSSLDRSVPQKPAAPVVGFGAGGVVHFRVMERSFAGVI
jgi:hypothetical protein